MKQYPCRDEERKDFHVYILKYINEGNELKTNLSDDYSCHAFRWNMHGKGRFLEFKQLQCLLCGVGLRSDELRQEKVIQGNKI